MHINKVLIIIFAFLLSACSNNNSENNPYFLGSDSSKFLKEVDSNNSYYKNIKKWEQELQLASIENGSKGFEMRLWYYPELLLRKKLFVVTYSGSNWSAKEYVVTVDLEGKIKKKPDLYIELTPRSGWNVFKTKLYELRIMQLPNYSYLQGDILLDDGITYIVEVANQNAIRFSWFSNPQQNIVNNKSAKHWQEIVNLFNSEFNNLN